MKRLALLTLALVLALGSMGVAYAAWTDEVTIEGSIATGDLCAEFGTVEIRDPHEPVNPGGDYPTGLPDWTCNDGFLKDPSSGLRFWPSDKNVGWGVVERIMGQTGECCKTLKVTLHNAYPSYFNEVTFYPENCGTIPWRINHVVVRWLQNGDPQESFILSHGTYVPLDYTGDGLPELELMWGNSLGVQVHPDDYPPEVSFWIHVLQAAPQNSTLEFTIDLVVVQWNEYPLALP